MAKRQRGKYGKWEVEDLERAVNAYNEDTYGLNECSRIFKIPKATLLRHVKNNNKIANQTTKKLGRETTFSEEVENDIVQHILKLEELMFGLSIFDIRKLAFDIAEKNHMKHNFDKRKRIAGKKWYYGFMKRHPNLTLRQPESTSIARAKGFNKTNVYHFFDLLEKICTDNTLDATRIYNVDESGFSTVQKRPQKIVSQKGKKQIGAVTSGERGVNTTMVCCTSASGNFVPPMIIFKRARMAPDLQVGAPAGSLVEISETGYINSELFTKWLKHFIDTVKPSKEKKVLLLLDGHSTHSKNLEALLLAREHGIILLQLPGHTTHRLQPLDVTFFKPMETYYTQAIEKYLRTNPGMKVSLFQVSALLSEAYSRAASIQTAQNGFKAAGIWPVNRYVFTDHHFAASENLNVQQIRHVVADSETGSPQNNGIDEEVVSKAAVEQAKRNLFSKDNPQPTTSGLQVSNSTKKCRLSISIEEVSPIPVPSSTENQRLSKNAQKAEKLTSTPYKDNLSSTKENKKKKVSSNKNKKKMLKGKPKTEKKVELKSQKKMQKSEGSWYCVLCKKEKQEDMIQCMECRTWVHATCANISPLRKIYFCPQCLLYDQ